MSYEVGPSEKPATERLERVQLPTWGCVMQIERSSSVRPSRRQRALQFGILLMLASLAGFQFANGVEAGQNKGRKPGAKPNAGWVCNAYGLSRTWRTFTGSPRPTKAAAMVSALKDCQSSHFACRPTGCWPR